MESGFNVTEEVLGPVRVVRVSGELTLKTAASVRVPLERAARDQDRPLVVDLTYCDFVDSHGLAALLHGTKPLQNGESNVAVVCPEGEVRRLLALTAIDQTLRVFDDFEQAAAWLVSHD